MEFKPQGTVYDLMSGVRGREKRGCALAGTEETWALAACPQRQPRSKRTERLAQENSCEIGLVESDWAEEA